VGSERETRGASAARSGRATSGGRAEGGASGASADLAGATAAALDALEAGAERALADLVALARIPSVSAAGFDPAQVARCADGVAALLDDVGLTGVEVLRLPGAHPAVYGEWRAARADAPTALIYAHHDVQPPGRLDRWRTPPFEPTVRPDGRLYGRGVVDDKAGLVLHLAALRAWREAAGGPPLHVKVLVEGEEEIGSLHLADFLRAERERLRADVLVLSDTANLATGIPSFTTSLRGLVVVDVEVRALDHPLHSGMWGGPVPDAATALCALLARLTDEDGAIAVPGLADDAPPLAAAERAALDALPYDADSFRADAGLPAGVPLSGERGRSVYEQLWLRPAIAVTALEALPLAESGNQLIDLARARIGLRLAPGQDAARAAGRLQAFLRADPPRGVRVETRLESASPGWRTEPVGPAFDAVRRALRAGFGREPVAIGCGGSIPFVGPFLAELGGAPALLLGLEDPPCNAHGENESLDLADFHKAARASVHLLAELASLPPRR
jgi:acetylornithine deacetylase/succinyl-diaminopimelate desuccinylase-like protein